MKIYDSCTSPCKLAHDGGLQPGWIACKTCLKVMPVSLAVAALAREYADAATPKDLSVPVLAPIKAPETDKVRAKYHTWYSQHSEFGGYSTMAYNAPPDANPFQLATRLEQERDEARAEIDTLKKRIASMTSCNPAQMSTAFGLLPVNSEGMRMLSDEVGRLGEELDKTCRTLAQITRVVTNDDKGLSVLEEISRLKTVDRNHAREHREIINKWNLDAQKLGAVTEQLRHAEKLIDKVNHLFDPKLPRVTFQEIHESLGTYYGLFQKEAGR